MSDKSQEERIKKAISEVEQVVNSASSLQDKEYFQYHKRRFYKMAASILSNVPKGGNVLDVGSHFLHSSIILTKLGYQVYAVDVAAFWEIDFIQQRMKEFGIEGITENDLESFNSMANKEDCYDAVLFTEILEHITFNPINFWKQVYRIVKDQGLVYITTPNSLALPSVIRAFRNLITFKGIGIKVEDIFSHVTYGHHWKEYSSGEIKRYFRLLSEDFEVKTYYFSFHQGHGTSLRDKFWYGLAALGQRLRYFSPCIEAIVRVKKSKGFQMDSPDYH